MLRGAAGGSRRGPLDPVDCVLCLVHGRIQQVRGRLDLEARVLARAAELVAEWRSRTDVFVDSYEYLLRLLGGDPYREVRLSLNRAAMEYLDSSGIEVRGAEQALELMAAANGIDIPMPGYKPSFENLVSRLREKPALRGLRSLGDLASDVERVVVVLDNAGEAVFDIYAGRVLAEEAGAELVLVAREEPYEIDVTLSEARDLAKRLAPKARLVGTGGRFPVFHPRASQEARRLVEDRSALGIVKGIANTEAYMDFHDRVRVYRGVFLLRAKCRPLVRFFDVGFADPVAASPRWIVERMAALGG